MAKNHKLFFILIIFLSISNIFLYPGGTLADDQNLPSVLLLNEKTKTVSAVMPNTGQKKEFYRLTGNEQIIGAKYGHQTNQLVYIKRNNQYDKLRSVNLNTGKTTELASLFHGNTDNNLADNNSLQKYLTFSPNEYYLTYSVNYWESCDDEIISLTTKQKLASDYCDALRWSQDGKRMLRHTSSGMATAAGFGLSQKGNVKKIIDVDFSKLKGDISKINLVKVNGKMVLADDILAADFMTNSKVVFATHLSTSSDVAQKILIYDEGSRSLKFITSVGIIHGNIFYIKPLNSVLLLYDNQKTGKISLGLINLGNGKQKEIFSADKNYHSSYIADIDQSAKYAVVTLADNNASPLNKILLINLINKNKYSLSDSQDESFIGFAK